MRIHLLKLASLHSSFTQDVFLWRENMMSDRKNFKLNDFDVEGGLTINDFDWIRYFSGIAAAVRGNFRPMMSVDTKKMLAVCKALAETEKDVKDGRETVVSGLSRNGRVNKSSGKPHSVYSLDFGGHDEGDN